MERLYSPHVNIAASRLPRATGKKSMSSIQHKRKPIPAFCCRQRMRQQPLSSRLRIQTSLFSLSASTMLFRARCIRRLVHRIARNTLTSKGSKQTDVCTALVGFHAFTGYDAVSVFGGKGKIGALTIIMKENAHQQCFSDLDQSWNISPNLLRKLQFFTCGMYVSR